MKKIIALLLVLVMAVSCFVGCEKAPVDDTKAPVTPTGDNTPDDTTAAPTEVEDRFDGKHDIVEVTVVIRDDPKEDDAQVVAAMNEILAERYNLKLNLIAIPGAEYEDRMTLMMTSNETWDWCYTASWTNNYYDRVSMGAYYDLNELMDTQIWADLMELYPEGWYDNAVIDGHLYGLPNYQIEYSPNAVFVQKSLADKYELPYKDGDTIHDLTDPEFYAWMKRVQEGESDMYIIRPKGSWMGAVIKDVSKASEYYDASIEIDDMSYTVGFEWERGREEKLDYYEKMLGFLQEGLFRPDTYTLTDDSADYKALRYACWIGTGKPGGSVSASASMGTDIIQIYMNDGVYYRTAEGGMTTVLGMNYASKDPEAALKFLYAMWADEDLYNMFVHGIEGEHYKKVGEKRVEPIADSGYSRSGYAWGFGNSFNAWLVPGQADTVWEESIAMNNAAKTINIPGFVFSSANVETEIGNRSTVNAEYKNQWMLCKDRAELEEWYDTYCEKLIEAGIMNIVEDVQKQIDAYCEANGITKQAK